MAFQKVVDTAEINIIYDQNGSIIQNVFYAELPGGYTLADLNALASVIDAQVQGTWKAQQNANAVYLRTEVRGLAVINDLLAINSLNAGPGVHVGGPFPNNVTFAVKKLSGLTGRSARGRCYWIGIPTGQIDPVDENNLLAPYVASVVAAVDSIRTSIDSAPLWSPVLVSRFLSGAARSEGVTFPWIGSTNVDLQFDTQRGRMP